MSGVYIPGDKVPTKCVGCSFRDPEYGGNCVLMPSFDADTYEEQFDRCPFKELRKRFGSVPTHGDLIDKQYAYQNTMKMSERTRKMILKQIDYLPIIIPADKEE